MTQFAFFMFMAFPILSSVIWDNKAEGVTISTVSVLEDPNEIYAKTWDDVLSRHVTAAGEVNYAALKADTGFAATVKAIGAMIPEGYWTREQQMAFWINAYNIYTIKLICDHYPVKSINDIDLPWDGLNVLLKDKKYSLNQLENTIIRKKYNDPRIHFAINCGAKSCPPLYNKAFRAENLNKTLASLTKAFINNSKYNKITANSIQISKIFEWFKDDFANNRTLVSFLNQYSSVQIDASATVAYGEYDWSLNKK